MRQLERGLALHGLKGSVDDRFLYFIVLRVDSLLVSV